MSMFKKKKIPADTKAVSEDMLSRKPSSLPIALGVQKQAKRGKMAPVGPLPQDHEMEEPASIAEKIRGKKTMMADGGVVDLEENSEESPNDFDDLNAEAANKEQYDDSQLSHQPLSSEGREMEDELDRSVVSAIRRKMASKLGS